MSHLQYFVYEGFGERTREKIGSSQAVRVGNTIEMSGQGGWDRITEKISEDLGEEVDQAFANVEHTLQQAGGKGWEQVYKLRCYCVPLDAAIIEHIVRNLKKALPTHQPILTVVGVPNLAFETMRIEMEVSAHLGD